MGNNNSKWQELTANERLETAYTYVTSMKESCEYLIGQIENENTKDVTGPDFLIIKHKRDMIIFP